MQAMAVPPDLSIEAAAHGLRLMSNAKRRWLRPLAMSPKPAEE